MVKPNVSAPDPLRAKVFARAAAIAPDEVGKVPSNVDERRVHLGAFARVLVRDAAELATVPLPDGALEAWEAAAFPVALAIAEELGLAVGADKLVGNAAPLAADVALLAEARADQAKIIVAYRRLRFKGDTVRLAELNAIAAGDADDVIDAADDTSKLLAIADHANERAWVASLPKGEGAAVARLKKHLPRLKVLAEAARGRKTADERRVELQRVWTVIARIERRARDAAAYLYDGLPRRAEYNAFAPLAKARVRAAKKAATRAKKKPADGPA